ncbi:MAG: type III pantothenate kinase [Acidimicrobiia bacterium]|nr:type III pantothenate kinase [Acidimicrobiia bacterium]
MLLVIDVGNTETVLGVFDGAELAAHWRVTTVRGRTHDEYRLLLGGVLQMEGYTRSELSGVAVSSVVPPATHALRDVAGSLADGPVLVVEPGVKTGMPILIDNPREVGADRIVNAVAAARLYGTPAVVVDFGTSTNFDVVSAAGEYIGGVISTGLEVSQEALIRATAALRRVELVPPRSVIGKGTVEAIQRGLLYGHAGLVDGLMNRILAELDGDAHTLATGGLASTIVPYCATVDTVDEFLTLHGLRLIAETNL